MRLVLSGYFGFGNVGDEAILAAIMRQLSTRMPSARITVLSANPAQTSRAYGVHAVNRWRLRSVVSAIRSADALIQGGGGLLQDATSRVSPAYYLGVLAIARLLGTPYAVFAQGFGPLRCRLWRWWAQWLWQRAGVVLLRDLRSALEVHRLGVVGIHLGADPAALLEPDADAAAEWCGLDAPALSELVVLVPRRGVMEDAQAEAAMRVGPRALLVPFQAADEGWARELAERCGGKALAVPPAPEVAAGLIACAGAVVSVRLHGLVFAAAAARPAVGIAYDPKVASFCEAAGYRCAREPAEAVDAAAALLTAPHRHVPDELGVRLLKSQAETAFNVLCNWLDRLRGRPWRAALMRGDA